MDMMKLLDILSEAYSEKDINRLIEKLQSQSNNIDVGVIRKFIEKFDKIKNSSQIKEKDITKYNWDQLVDVITNFQTKKENVGKFDINDESDSNLIYNKDNLKIYLAPDKKSCIKYGKGYRYCISARSDENMFNQYAYHDNNTIYFVFDQDQEISSPFHLLVILVSMGIDGLLYDVYSANNDELITTWDFNKVAIYSYKIRGLKHLFKQIDYSGDKNYQIETIKKNLRDRINYLFQEYDIPHDFCVTDPDPEPEEWTNYVDEIKLLISGTLRGYTVKIEMRNQLGFFLGETIKYFIGIKNGSGDENLKRMEDMYGQGNSKVSHEIYEFPNDYIEQVRDAYKDYRKRIIRAHSG